jgi:hypothetical protein
MTLLELQRRMSTDVTRPLTPDFYMQSQTEDGTSIEKIAETYVKSNDRLSSFDRLEIYNRQYWFRVIGAVAEDFSALQAVVGAKKFDSLVLAYLRENPSTSFTLRNLGAKLPQWLAAHPELVPRRHQLALDVARLEWAYVEAYDGAAAEPLTESDFAALGEHSTLRLQPYLHLLALQYPVDELVLAVHKASPETEVSSNASSEQRRSSTARLPTMRRSAIYLAVHRYTDSVYYRRLDREAYLLFVALQQQKSFSEAVGVAFVDSMLSSDERAPKIREYFMLGAQLGWFTR